MRLLDRYVLRNFLEPFLICFCGFIAILLIFDLYDNGPDFIQYHTPVKLVLHFYATQLPAMTLLSLPVGMLLALLFSLSKMSRHNEIISMLTAGCSLSRVILPLVFMGLVATALCFLLNVAMAPHADAIKKHILEEITKGTRRAEQKDVIQGHLFRDRMNNRTWFIRRLRQPSPGQAKSAQAKGDQANPPLEGVHISQQDENGNVVKKWYATRATFDKDKASWALYDGMIVDFDAKGDITRTDAFPNQVRVIDGWTETPLRIESSQLQAQNLSIQELHDYLGYNGDFPPTLLAPYRTNLYDRWAFPWSCLVIVFIAAPLGVVYNRRGVLGGVAGAIFLFICTILLRYFLLALGKGARLDPMAAAWLPNLIFFLVGLVLLFYRATNRDFPKLLFWR